jgi:hypothetical protein
MRKTQYGIAIAGLLLASTTAHAGTGWKQFRCKEGGFAVMMPGTPNYLKKTSQAGRTPLVMHVYGSSEGGNAFIVGYADCPPEAVQLLGSDYLIDSFRAGFIRGAQGRISAERQVALNGVSLREFRIITGSGNPCVLRVGVVGSRLYQLVATSSQSGLPGGAARFLDSFSVAAAARAAAPKLARSSRKPRSASPARPVTPPPAKPAGVDPAWKPLRSQEGGFSVSVPGAAAHKKHVLSRPEGRLDYHEFSVQAKTDTYRVGYVDYPETASQSCDVRSVLDAERNAYVESVEGKLTHDEPVELDGNPGTQFRIALANNTSVFVRLLLVGSRVYRLEVQSPTERYQSNEAVKFVESFKLLK